MQKNVEINKASFMSFLYEFKYALLFFVIGDTITTIYSLNNHIGYEYNSIIAPMINYFGAYSLFIPKLIFVCLLYTCYIYANTVSCFRIKRAVEIIGITVTANNLMVIFFSIGLFQLLGIAY